MLYQLQYMFCSHQCKAIEIVPNIKILFEACSIILKMIKENEMKKDEHRVVLTLKPA